MKYLLQKYTELIFFIVFSIIPQVILIIIETLMLGVILYSIIKIVL